MRMQKRKFRIGELAEQLDVERFVIRFWEKEFGLKSTRSEGRQRFYDERDLALFTQIKSLLYKQGFTIAGAKKQLKMTNNKKNTKIVASQKTTMDEDSSAKKLLNETQKDKEQLEKKIVHLQKQLMKLRELL